MHRGDTALWILTKMAMLFFIISLAALLLVFGGKAREGLCLSQAHTLSQTIATAISQVIDSPLEDERRVVGIPTVLSLGSGTNSRYTITISRWNTLDPASNALIIQTSSDSDPSCKAGVQLTYDQSWDEGSPKRLQFVHAHSRHQSDEGNPITESMQLRPSVLCDGTEGSSTCPYGPRTTFLSIVKCTTKDTQKTKHAFIQDCTQENARNCLGGPDASGNIFTGGLSVCKFE